MKVLQYAKTENFIRPHASGLMVNNLPAGECLLGALHQDSLAGR